jgi:hypothetical protein
MKVIQLQAENLKRLKAIDITPDGNVVTIGGRNEAGKSTVLDAIWIALKGRAAAPPVPIRKGEDKATIRLDMGELVVTRTFTAKEGGEYTDTLKVVRANGDRPSNPQAVLNDLLGDIGFDPFAFATMKPEAQADMLMGMVPLSVDLDDLAEADQSDYTNRRDVNRDLAAAQARLAGVPPEEVPEDAPDREALTEALGKAADTNIAIDRDRADRQSRESTIVQRKAVAEAGRAKAAELRKQADIEERDAALLDKGTAEREVELAALPPLADPVDTDAIRTQLREAEATLAAIDRQKRRAALVKEIEELTAKSEGYTAAMAGREKQRTDALTKAKMPIPGLTFGLNAKGKVMVMLDDVPFEQGSTAQKLKASTAIAMAANPTLRVLRIEDGSLLDEDSLALLTQMAKDEDYQLWAEFVGTHTSGGQQVGILLENGAVVDQDKPKAKAADKPADGALL